LKEREGMDENQLKVLKFLSALTRSLDFREFTQMIGLSSNQTLEIVRELKIMGFVKEARGGFSLTREGMDALKTHTTVPEDKKFHFYKEVDKPTGLSANSLKTFYERVGEVDVASLEFHSARGDFERWVKNVLEDPQLADELARIRASGLKGEDLRKEISEATESRYGNLKMH
jgi:DNA-binding Lrp family transcriptional regulator